MSILSEFCEYRKAFSDFMISIIIPVYNVEKYLPMCMDSVLQQTNEDFECILVDDGSTDSSGEICDHYAKKDLRIKVLHKENHGVSSARNIGIDAAKGQYIMFIDSDDFIESVMLEVLLKDIREYDVDIACCDFFERNMGSNIVTCEVLSTDDALKKLLVNEICFGNYNKLFKKECIGTNRFNTDITHGEDLLFNVLVMQDAERISYNKKGLYHHVYRIGSASQQFTTNRFSELKTKAIIADELKGRVEIKPWVDLNYSRTLIGIAKNICKTTNLSDTSYYDYIRKLIMQDRLLYKRNKLATRKEVLEARIYTCNMLLPYILHKIHSWITGVE